MTLLPPTLRDSLAGMAGTAMMTLMMRVVAPQVIPEDIRPNEFVPKQVVKWTERQAGHTNELSAQEELKASYPLHFGYGSTMYSTLRPHVPNLPPPLPRALYGVGAWAFSFEQLLPRLGVMPATMKQSKRKWPPPVMAHVVFGATTAIAYDALKGLSRD